MMLYHYTSIEALESILQDTSSDKGLCFWATRFDCFGDKEEYKLGISSIKRILPRLEERIRPDRRISSSFVWEDIKENITLPFPYIVSFTDRFDNEYMWDQYGCRGKGVVLGIDDTERIVNKYTEDLFVKGCIYLGDVSDDDLYKELEDEFYYSSLSVLTGPKKEIAFALLAEYPQLFVALIGRYLLAYVAPRIKSNVFDREKETRAILAPPRGEMESLILQYEEAFKTMLDPESLKEKAKSEKKRVSANGETVYYRELYLPGRVLTKLFVRDRSLIESVKTVLLKKGFNNVSIALI